MKFALAAISATSMLLLSGTAFAAPREKFTLSLSSEGYDLSNPSDVARLNRKIDAAVIEACNPSDRISDSWAPDLKCRREMRQDAALKIAAMAERAKQQRMAGI